MRRREFVKTGLLAGASAATLGSAGVAAAGNQESSQRTTGTFNLKYAPHFGMFSNHAGDDLIDQLRFAYDQGFRAWEDNGMKGRSVEMQERIAQTMGELGMDMGVFVAHTIYWDRPNLASGDPDLRAQFLSEIRESVEVARRVNATWMTVVPGHADLRLEMDYQTANVVESLRRAAEILEPHGLVMVLEPLNWFRDHPGQFLTKVPQAYKICKAVNSPSCKILFDIYHQQITEGNIIPNLDMAWDEVAYLQIGDNPGRNEPTTGEINYRNVFRHVHEKRFAGILGMEHGKSQSGRDGERRLLEAYRSVDAFI
ncbi:MAG: hydroxypyruvate isomerase family protein [Bacteroidota bacterium]